MPRAEGQTPIAIVGLDCRLPGAEDPTAYWNLLESGRSALGELPPDRLDRELYFSPEKGTQGKTYTTIGGIVPDRPVRMADLGLSGTSFEHTDSAFLAICDVAARALRNAGLEPFHLPHRHAGVYLGSTGGTRHSTDWIFATLIEETAGYLRDLPAFRDNLSTLDSRQLDRLVDTIVREVRQKYGWRNDIPSPNLSAHVAAHAISRAFNLTGPSMALDAACASSLQAMALGVQALRLGTIDMAIVGGASCLKQHSLVLFSAAQSLTAFDSRPFDAGADGLVAAEGYVALVLKRLADAVADGDPIWGVIRDIASASDGKGKSLWAPRKEGQILAMQRVYQRGIDIHDLQYIEAHATSTQVGDATELTALTEALGPHLAPGQRIALGASKGNIGHTLETAGIAGVAKVLLALERRTIPPVAGIRQPNPKVDWDRSPFYLPFQAEPWPELPGRPRLASVNSFGIGGLNTHVVLEEYRAEKHQRHFASATPRPITAMAGRPDPEPILRSTSGTGSAPATGTVSSEQRLSTEFAPIAIVGMGAILPGAFTVKSLSELLETASDARCGPPEGRWSSAARQAWQSLIGDSDQPIIGGFLDGYQYDWRKNKVPPKQVAQGNPLQFLLLDATAEALRSAGYDSRPLNRQRTAVVVGSIFRGDFCDQLQMGLRLPEFHSHLVPHLESLGWTRTRINAVLEAYDERLLERMPALLDETGSFTASTLASRITKAFDLMGGAVAIDAGEASGMAAMAVGIDQLRRGDCEMVICAGANQSLDFCAFQSIVSRGKRLPPNNDARPFGEHSFASPPGEGVAVVILKPLAAAERDGDPVFAVIRGLGLATDPEHPSRAAELAIRAGLQAARLTPSEIDALETDGSDGEHEIADIEAIAKVFETSPSRFRPLPLRSLAGQIGQCGAAMGNASVIAATIQLAQRQLFPGPKVVEPAAHIRRHERTLRPFDESLALPSGDPASDSQGNPTAKARIGVLSGIASGSSYFAILETGNMQSKTRHPVSTSSTVIAATPSSETRPPETNSVNATSPPTRIVWLFPGQGSQYPEMLRSLAAQCQPVAATIAEADAVLRAMGLETFTRIAWEDARELGTDLWRTQLAMLVADYAMARALTSLGAQPDLVAGHSFGELAALVAANCWSLEDAIRGTWERADAQRRSVSEPAGLMAIFASRDRVESLIAWAEKPVFIANHNAPEQVIVGGSRAALEQFAAVAKSHRINTSILPVPSAFHTPLMAAAVQPFAAGLSKLAMRTGEVPVMSTATNRAMIDPADYRDSLIASLTLPVRYVDLIHRLDSEQPTLFIEVGPQRVLTKLNQKILGSDRAHTLPTDEPKGNALEPLQHAARLCAAIANSRSASSRMLGPRALGSDIANRAITAPGRLLQFDATERRRDARRRTGSHNNSPDEIAAATASPLTAAHVARVPEATSPPSALPTAPPARPPAKPSTTPPTTPSTAVSADSLRSFLLRFVVDQTGYPEEMIELDSNLEADLGIDSIKKAQLFGEIAEQFQVAPPSGPVTLDDYPTLRHVFDYLVSATGAASVREESPPVISQETLRSFLLRFVVEQTGYPEDMVELDSNLEADLGIDSIKKAQLFGEIAEQFQVAPPSGPVTLDDYPTLRHVLDYLQQATGAVPAQQKSRPASAHQRVVEEATRVMSRCVFDLRGVPLGTVPREKILGRVLLVGRNPDCDALSVSLEAQGAAVMRMESPGDPDSAARELLRLCGDGPPPTLVLVSSRDSERIRFAQAGSWQSRLEPGLIAPFALCQKWFELATAATTSAEFTKVASSRPTLVAVTAMGGGFGFQTPIASAESGGIAGLLKAIKSESQGKIRVHVIDFPNDYASSRLAENVIAELLCEHGDIEVGYDSQGRRSVVHEKLEPASSLPFEPLPTGTVWLVTGGARGVTAWVARELGRRFGWKLHLIGSSRLKALEPRWRGLPRDQWKSLRGEIASKAREQGHSPTAAWEELVRQLELAHSLQEFESAGVKAEYHTCDVADSAQLEQLIADVRGRDGRIDGVIHGAGVEVAASFGKKRWENVRKTLDVKAGGAAHLMRLLHDDPPRHFIAFSSVSGRFGGFGQTDYSMANDLLCKMVKQFADQHPTCRAICLDWPAWDEIGMAARPESRFALQAMKVRFMPPSEGVQHLIDELQVRSRHTEVAFVDPQGRSSHVPVVESTTSSMSASEKETRVHEQARELGRRHRAEIVEFIQRTADQWDDSVGERLVLPECLRQAFAMDSERYLEELAASAGIALASLLAQRKRYLPSPANSSTNSPAHSPAKSPANLPAVTSPSMAFHGSTNALDLSPLPLIDSIVAADDKRLTVRVLLRPESDIFLRDHLVHDKPFLPAVASAEILAEVASLLAPGLVFAGFRDLEFLQGQPFASDAPVAVEATVQRVDHGWSCELTGPGVLGGESKTLLVRGVAEFIESVADPPRFTIDNPNYRWNPFSYAERGYAPVLHGPSLRTVAEIALQRDGGRIRLTAREPLELAGERSGGRWLMPSALLDGCLVACGTYAFIMLDGRYGLPRGVERLRIFGLPDAGQACRCRFTLKEQNADCSWYDFHLVDSSGRCLALAENYCVANLSRRK